MSAAAAPEASVSPAPHPAASLEAEPQPEHLVAPLLSHSRSRSRSSLSLMSNPHPSRELQPSSSVRMLNRLGMRANATGKPSGLPENWPDSTSEQIERIPKRVIKIGEEQAFYFRDNFVKTSKYEIYNFLPKFLTEEFNPRQKMANVYFLLVSGLQCIPIISNTGGLPTTLLPLTFVVLVDGIFAVLEDLGRHKADELANASITRKFNKQTQEFEECSWFQVQVGDMVQVLSRETIPADMIILACHEKNEPAEGVCYIETKSLDGETNLKTRTTLRSTINVVRGPQDLTPLKGEVVMEHPNKLIESFTGTIDLQGIEKEPVQVNNILLRGTVLRNTDWIIGLVVNTGHDTKIMMSNIATPSKSSSLERRSSFYIQCIVFLLLFVCFVGATGEAIWNNRWASKMWYLHWTPQPGSEWFIKFFYFFLLHATFIPVSLYVSMSVVRFFQAFFMNNDLDMYNDANDTPARVRTMTLNEELGQISHIFSDKTGTLTCNVMDFRKCSINGVPYGRGTTEIGKAALFLQGLSVADADLEADRLGREKGVPHVSFFDPTLDADMEGKSGDIQKLRILEFFRALSICHSVIVEKIDNKSKLSASSPDDEALVCAAEYFGFGFKDRQESFALIQERNGIQRYQILETLEFTSSRKRMSAIVRFPNGSIRVLSKGADSTMLQRLKPGQDRIVQSTWAHMNSFASEGLRCLVIAFNDLSDAEYNSWRARYQLAITDLDAIERRKGGKENSIDDLMDEIEQNFTIIGATAIEDKLQDGVPECVAELGKAGIKIWVLTGDKEETAINISVACNLIKPVEYMDRIIINRQTCPAGLADMKSKFAAEIERLDDEIRTHGAGTERERALVIDGQSLIDAFASDCKDLLLKFSVRCQAVVACRVSPDQKRQMVLMIKEGVPGVRTLAIGDGANDVAMIQAAHVGVGISGQEGMQAVNSSDFAIAQFAFLRKLLLCHGRWNYRRMCKLVCYMFYKNIMMSIAQFWFAWTNGFSGQKMYNEGGIQLFNLVFTCVPILLLGVYDQDVSKEMMFLYPMLYKPCIEDFFFRPQLFLKWIGNALVESVLVCLIPLFGMENSGQREGSMWLNGSVSFTAVVFVVNIKIFIIQNMWTWLHAAVLIASILSWFGIASAITSLTLPQNGIVDYDYYYVFFALVSVPSSWLCVALLIVLCNGKDVAITGYSRNYVSQAHHHVQERDKGLAGDEAAVLPITNVPDKETGLFSPGAPHLDPQVAMDSLYERESTIAFQNPDKGPDLF